MAGPVDPLGSTGKAIHGQDVFPGGESIGQEEIEAATEVLLARSLFRYYGLDLKGKVREFEQEFAKTMGVRHALGVSSGTAALFVSLNALGVGAGDEVIVPGYTFIASMEVIPACKAIPVVCEVNESLTIDPADFESKITERTRAVVVVHMRGIACDMDPILEIARRRGVKVVEDCAQATGALYRGRRIGTLGDIGAFSLQYHKIITSGEGGCVITNDADLFKRAIRFHDHGYMRFDEYGNEEGVEDTLYLGLNFRMSELAGAVAGAQLKKLDRIISAMRRNKAEIKQAISDIEGISFRPIPDPEGEAGSTLFFFTQNADTTAKLAKELGNQGVAAFIPYHSGPHVYAHWRQLLEQAIMSRVKCPFECPLYKGKVSYDKDALKRTDDTLKRALHLDISPSQTHEDNMAMAAAIRRAAGKVLGTC